jgi:hypothetical protein
MTYFVHYKNSGNVRRINNVLHICTSNDANGSPRRMIVCLGNYGHIVATFDEGLDWGGLYGLHKDFASWTNRHCVRVNVTVSEFNRWASLSPGEISKVSTQPELPVFQE